MINKSIYIVCSVRGMDDEYRKKLELYVSELESNGHKVYLPHRDTPQEKTVFTICKINGNAIINADEIHLFYNPKSQGTHFDLGIAFISEKPIKIIEMDDDTKNEKSFKYMLKDWEQII